MPWSQVGLESDSERCFLNAFVKLKKMRMPWADADPNDLYDALRRKRFDSLNRQKKGAKFNRLQFFAQGKIDILRHVGKKPERQVHLIAGSPMNAANARIKVDQNFSD